MTDRNKNVNSPETKTIGIIRAIGLGWPLLIFLVIMEFCILRGNYLYERDIAPEGVILIWGLTGFGAAMLLFEAMRIPLVLWGATFRSRPAKCGLILLVAILCIPTWNVMKDMVTNQFIASLKPSANATQEADLLTEANDRLESQILTVEEDSERARAEITRIQEDTTERLSALRTRRAELETQWQTRIDELEDSHFLTTAESAQIKQIEDEIERLDQRQQKEQGRLETQLARIEARLDVERTQNAERHASETDAWNQECERIKATYQTELTAWKDAQSLRRESVREASKRHDEQVALMRERIRSLEQARDEEIDRLRKEDAAKTFGNWSLDSDIAAVEKKFEARIAEVQADIRNMKTPEDSIADHARPVMPELPPRPRIAEVDTTELEQTLALLAGLGDRMRAEATPLREDINSIRESAAVRATEVMETLNAQRQDLITQRNESLARLDEESMTVQRERTLEIDEIKGAVMDKAQMLSWIQSSRATIDGNKGRINDLRMAAITLREKTDINMMSQFLSQWMPDSTVEDRDEAVIGAMMPLMLFILIPIPPIVIELIIAGAIKRQYPERNRKKKFLSVCGIARKGVTRARARRDRDIERTTEQMAAERDAVKADAEHVLNEVNSELARAKDQVERDVSKANQLASEMLDEQIAEQEHAMRSAVGEERRRLNERHQQELARVEQDARQAAEKNERERADACERADALEREFHEREIAAQKHSLEMEKIAFEEKLAIETNAANQCIQAKTEVELLKARYGATTPSSPTQPRLN